MPGGGKPAASAPPLPGAQSVHVAVPGTPFGVAVALAGAGAVVALPGRSGSALAWLSAEPEWAVDHVATVAPQWVPRGVALAAGGTRAVVAAGAGLLVVELPSLTVAVSIEVADAVLVQVALDASERFAFATDEEGRRVVVCDLASGGVLGEVAVPPGPVGLALDSSTDHMLVTSQHAAPGRQDGVVSSLAIADALERPGRVRVTPVAAGWQPVRVTAGPDGRVWVTARGSNSLLGFDGARLVAGRAGALRDVVRVGAAPVGVAVAAGGARVVVANSDRYGDGDAAQSLSVLDTGTRGGAQLIGTVAAGVFPREVAVAPDGRTVLVGNFRSRTVQVVRLPGA